jgi:hypothetical protein
VQVPVCGVTGPVAGRLRAHQHNVAFFFDMGQASLSEIIPIVHIYMSAIVDVPKEACPLQSFPIATPFSFALSAESICIVICFLSLCCPTSPT